ncbi:HEAT repeat domain-containing protein [Planctomicrobium sp. SH664]|uniref:HEAT repeat domain-containing protein n=1 Tax=Planctomicrobium sp. SH664 TaxID=3448125 RepID=UPI003F5C24DC
MHAFKIFPRIWQLGLLAVAFAFPGQARGDVARLKSGGEIRGELVSTESQSGPVSLKTRSGAIITVDRSTVEFVKRRTPVVEDYITRSRQIENTIEAHLELAEWCRTQHLTAERKEQLEAVLDLDSDHAEARRSLGYEKHFGRWLTRDDLMTERGYVKHKGKWITRQEFDHIEKTDQQRSAELVWYPKVRLWLGWATGNHPGKRSEGLSELQQIRDPSAVAAMTSAMADHADRNVRLLYIRTLGEISGRTPIPPLVDRCLFDSDESVRRAAAETLTREDYPFALPFLVKALRHESNPVVCRAALVLSQIGDRQAVSPLIGALVTAHTLQMEVPDSNPISIGTVNGQTRMINPGLVSGSIPYDVAALARAGQLPYGYTVTTDPHIPVRTKLVSVRVEVRNEPVLTALQTLTGKNLGYNERDWQVWWAVQKG